MVVESVMIREERRDGGAKSEVRMGRRRSVG